jgi:hypothetical protein
MIWVRRGEVSAVGAVPGQEASRNAPYKRFWCLPLQPGPSLPAASKGTRMSLIGVGIPCEWP